MSSEGKQILILGAGFGGLTTANILQKYLSLSSVKHQISIVDSKDYLIMGLVNLWILSGIRTLVDSKIVLSRLENEGISYLNGEVTSIDPVSRTVTIEGSSTLRLEYDYLVIALGSEFALEHVYEGLENYVSFAYSFWIF